MIPRTRSWTAPCHGLLAALLLLGALAAQQSRPASAPATPIDRLLAELRFAPAGPEGARERERILRKWFVLRQPEHHQALQALLASGQDEASQGVVLGFLQADLAALLEGGGESTPAGKLFLGYLDPLIRLAGEGPEALARKSEQVLREVPPALLRERVALHLKPPGGPLLGAALVVAGSFQDASLAPEVAAWLETPAHGRTARATLLRLTFQRFRSRGEFTAWWEAAGTPSWSALRDRFLERNLAGEENRQAGEEAVARQAREQVRSRFLPLVRDLVELRVRNREWVQPLALLSEEETRPAALKGLVAAFLADRKLLERVGPDQEKACWAALELLLDLACDRAQALNGDLLQTLSFLSNLPAGREQLSSRALECLLTHARSGPPDARPTVLGYLAAFSGWEADRALFEFLCEPESSPEVLFRLLDLLKGRILSESGPAEEVGPTLERVLRRLPELLGENELPRRVRSDSLLFAARLPSAQGFPFLESVLLGREGLGARLEDRLAAADALQDLLLRQRKSPGVVEKVAAALQTGLKLRDAPGLALARVRAACAEKLAGEPFADSSLSTSIVESLGLALVIEGVPEAFEAIVTSLRKLGQRMLKDPASKGLQKARFFLLQRLENPSRRERVPGEGDLLFPAVVELCGADSTARRKTGRAFATMGHREHALSLFESLTSVPGGPGPEPDLAPAEQANLLREHLATLLTGVLPREGAGEPEPILPGLGQAEWTLGRKLMTRLKELRGAGALSEWGRREQEWSLAISWGLAVHQQNAGASGAELFAEAAEALKELLATQSLPAAERLRKRVRLAEALLAAAQVRPQALEEALGLLQALVQEEPALPEVRRLFALVLERREAWSAAALQWQALAELCPQASLEEWEALLQALSCLAKAGPTAPGTELLARLRSHPLPPEGPGRERVEKELARLAALLQGRPGDGQG